MKHTLFSILLGLTLSMPLAGQETLAELVEKAKAEWMLGQWEASTEDGTTVTHSFAWDLEKHVVVLHGRMGEREYKGYTSVDPESGEVRYVGFDNRGSVSKGVWSEQSGEVILRLESRRPQRDPTKMAVVFGGTAAEGLKLRIHEISDSGELAATARVSLSFKKK